MGFFKQSMSNPPGDFRDLLDLDTIATIAGVPRRIVVKSLRLRILEGRHPEQVREWLSGRTDDHVERAVRKATRRSPFRARVKWGLGRG